MMTLTDLTKCYERAKENISTPNNKIVFNRDDFIKTIGCTPEELKALCAIKQHPEWKYGEKEVSNEYIVKLVNSGNEEGITITYHDGIFYQLFTERNSTFEIVDVIM